MPPQIMSQPIARVTPNVASGENGYRVSAVPFEFAKGTTHLLKVSDTSKTQSALAVANGANIVGWTPAAGFTIRLDGAIIQGSNAGLYVVKMGLTEFARLFLQVNIPFTIPIGGKGLCLGVADAQVIFFNLSGAASDMIISCWGTEL